MKPVQFGALLKRTRVDAGQTQATLANVVGITPAAYSHWENGRTLPNVVQFVELCRALKCEPADLLPLRRAS